YQHGRFGEVGHGQGRGCLTLDGRKVFQARIDAQQDQRDDGVPFIEEHGLLLDGPGGEGLVHGLAELPDLAVMERPHHRSPGGEAGSLAIGSARSPRRTRWWYRKLVRSSSSATRNRLAASMLRSSAAASCLAVSAAHASAVSSPSTEVSSMNWATSGGCCSRTSAMK